jgi:hypothetical protein
MKKHYDFSGARKNPYPYDEVGELSTDLQAKQS